MIIRYAIFMGSVKAGMTDAMRNYVEADLAPLWRQFPCAQKVKVLYGHEQDATGPNIPLLLAITYASHEDMAKALDSPARYKARDLLPGFYETYFDEVVLHHYLMAPAK